MAPERFGPYVVGERLGRGGMGEVHRATDSRKDRAVALKRLPVEITADPATEARFRREAEVAARLIEPHVIPIHDYGQIDGRLFLDMRLVEGVDLAAELRSGPFPPRRAVSIVGQIADALDAAHGDGLVHRDVKPSNILLTNPPRDSTAEDFVYLIDFGIAASEMLQGQLTAPNAALGTAAYMAPERFTSGHDNPGADVYGLGCVLFEILTGRLPFDEPGIAGQLWAHANAPTPTVSRVAPSLHAFDAVIAGALAKDPAARFARASDLAEAARRALGDVDVTSPAAAHSAPSPRTSPPGSPAAAPSRIAPPVAVRAPSPPVPTIPTGPTDPSPPATPPADSSETTDPVDGVDETEQARRERLRSGVKIGLRTVGNVGALVVNVVWLLVAVGVLVAVDDTPVAIGGVVAVGGGIASAIFGLTTSGGRRRSRWTLLAWTLLLASIITVIVAVAGAA